MQVIASAKKQVQKIFQEFAEFNGELRRIPCDCVAPHPLNRGGQDPLIVYCHVSLGPKIRRDEYDPDIAKFGVVIKVTSPEKLKRLLDLVEGLQNRASELYPRLFRDRVIYFSIASTHLTITLRLFNARMRSAITGEVFVPKETDADARFVLAEGHQYKVLREDCPDDALVAVSNYYNAEQDGSLMTTETSQMCGIANVVEKVPQGTLKISLGSIITQMQQSSVIRLSSNTIGQLAKFVSMFRKTENPAHWKYLLQFFRWHAANINPRSLVVSPKFFSDAADAFGSDSPLTLSTAAAIVYDSECVIQQAEPLPDVSKFLGPAELISYAKDPVKMKTVEAFLQDNRTKREEPLATILGAARAIQLLQMMEQQTMRMGFGKSLNPKMFDPKDYKIKLVANMPLVEKLDLLHRAWLKHIATTEPELQNTEFGIVEQEVDKTEGTEVPFWVAPIRGRVA